MPSYTHIAIQTPLFLVTTLVASIVNNSQAAFSRIVVTVAFATGIKRVSTEVGSHVKFNKEQVEVLMKWTRS